jgi:hypothetical protein
MLKRSSVYRFSQQNCTGLGPCPPTLYPDTSIYHAPLRSAQMICCSVLYIVLFQTNGVRKNHAWLHDWNEVLQATSTRRMWDHVMVWWTNELDIVCIYSTNSNVHRSEPIRNDLCSWLVPLWEDKMSSHSMDMITSRICLKLGTGMAWCDARPALVIPTGFGYWL